LETQVLLEASETGVPWKLVSVGLRKRAPGLHLPMFERSIKHMRYNNVTVGTTQMSILVRSFLSLRRAASLRLTTSRVTSPFSWISTEFLWSMATSTPNIDNRKRSREVIKEPYPGGSARGFNHPQDVSSPTLMTRTSGATYCRAVANFPVVVRCMEDLYTIPIFSPEDHPLEPPFIASWRSWLFNQVDQLRWLFFG
jgi:hypothetical protein